MPPPNTQTPASFASCTTACAASETAWSSSAENTMAELGNEMRYLVMLLAPSMHRVYGTHHRQWTGQATALDLPANGSTPWHGTSRWARCVLAAESTLIAVRKIT